MLPAISIEQLSKRYQLGVTHSGSVREAVNRVLAKVAGKKQSPDLEAIAKAHPNRVVGDQFWALRNIDLEIQPGEVVGLIGRNGAGKSTLLKILSQITKPTEGRAIIRGRVAALLEVGTGFHPELTGRENVYLNGTILGMSKAEVKRQFDAIVNFAGVETFVDTPVKRYSSGMTVRLGFAVAAHLQPEVMIVDEVLAVGDASFQEKCIGKMSEMGNEGRTIVFVSHSMSAIEQLTRKCFVVNDGQCVFEGPSADAVDHYLDRQRRELAQSSDVSTLPRVSWAGDQAAKIVRAELPDLENGKLTGNEPIRMRLGILGKNEIQSFSFGLTLNYRDGTPVGSAFSVPCGPIRANESQTFELQLATTGLSPGHYWMTIGLMRGNREATDVITEVLHFDIEAPERLPPGFVDWNPGWGRIKFDATCRLV
ncbi:Teichoic acids export ATP-binding protein TagH [Stieleria neptunia]|uniref:Teichoic acids export ATP-binding protein TagH n=1 Tax=Stieleria neptunia TaxID=2527979 RepID=A0A518HQR7_9BACT|nr:ABC transporter ATP-binding protein [Stieleria neptunia]QDV43141.1 Teichoic acids export ATP-binding protein TagH [Stieleria neptunia]